MKKHGEYLKLYNQILKITSLRHMVAETPGISHPTSNNDSDRTKSTVILFIIFAPNV